MTKVKNRKENRKGAKSSTLSIVKGVIGHLSMDVHMQDTQAYTLKITAYHSHKKETQACIDKHRFISP